MLHVELTQEEAEASHLSLRIHFSFHGDLMDLMKNEI